MAASDNRRLAPCGWPSGDCANAELIAQHADMQAALEWIGKIALTNYEQDVNLRSNGARTLLRICDKAEAILARVKAKQ